MKVSIPLLLILIFCFKLSTTMAQTTSTEPVYTPVISPWWTHFNDALLDSLERIGLENNLDLQVMVARVDEARERIKVTQSYKYPSAQLNPYFASQSLSQNRPIAISLQDGQLLNRFLLETYQLPVDMRYEVDLWHRVKNQVKESTQRKEATEAELKAAALTVSSEIARFYFLLRAIDTEQVVVQRGISLRDSTLEIAEARYEAGLVNQMDVQRAETEVAIARVQLEELNRNRRVMELSMGVLIGMKPSDINIARGDLPAFLPVVPAFSESELSRHRPDLMQSERMIASTNTQVDIVKAARLPRLNILGSAGFVSRGFSQMFNPNSVTYLVGASISLPIFEGFRNRSNINIAQKEVQIAETIYQQRFLVAIQEVETAVSNLEMLSRQALVQQQALQSAQKTRLYARELYVKGLTSFLEAIDAERTALDLERQAVNMKGHQVMYTIALIKAMGGSW